MGWINFFFIKYEQFILFYFVVEQWNHVVLGCLYFQEVAYKPENGNNYNNMIIKILKTTENVQMTVYYGFGISISKSVLFY